MKLKEVADFIGGNLIGDPNIVINGVGTLDDASDTEITFLANSKYVEKVLTTRAAAVILPVGADSCGKNVIEVNNPYLAFAKILTVFYVKRPAFKGVMEGAFVNQSAKLGREISIYPGSYIGEGVVIGERVTIYPGATIYDHAVIGDDVIIHSNVAIREKCRIGNRVILQNGAVIGSDGFGYAPDGKDWYKIPQIGIVVIEDDVEVGANTTIDRAALEVTLIKRGTKIDNQVQIAHNCKIGENCIFASQVGIAGSTEIGKHVTLAGQVGVAGHIKIGDNAILGAQAGVPGNVESGAVLNGYPAIPHKEWVRSSLIFSRLPEMKKNLAALEKRVVELEKLSS
ncbi:MAG: UDP-3-O-(3-hydroxymyristoyl)glucosamine N-acyltransferase [Desulfuromonadales bacterium]|nr:UDP-3-O-(3-hydroxymyristoyl)glucosamine N-acyltransferase [Desulfuromonadales bacterium]